MSSTKENIDSTIGDLGPMMRKSKSGTGRALSVAMKLLSLSGLMVVAACTGGESHDTTRTVTDTTVTPVHVTDTTVVQKKVDVTTDTLKKTRKKP